MTKFTVLFFFAGLIIIFSNLGNVLLFDVDEAVFAQASKEMFHSKDWLNPTYNGINRYDKPILIYWLMVASYSIFGVNEFSARLPSSIAGLLLAISLYLFSKRYFLKERSDYVLIPFLFCPYFLIYSRAAVTDMTLTLFITLSLLIFYINKGLISSLGFHLFAALAFLTKGLIGLVFPYSIALGFVLITKNWQRLKIIFNPLGIILFFAISMPWYIAQYNRNGFEFIEQFFLKHHFKRYTDVISGHKGPFYYYFIALFVGLSPWSLLIFSGIKKAWQERTVLYIFCTIWLIVVVGFFSLSATKLPNYILPCIPAVVLLIGAVLDEIDSKWFKALIIPYALLLSIISFIAPTNANKYIPINLEWLYLIGLINIATIIVFIFPNKKYGYLSLRMLGLTFGMVIIFLIIALKLLPMAGDFLQGDLKRYSLYAKERLKDDEKIFVYRLNKPSILFYSDRNIVSIGSTNDAEKLLNTHKVNILISKAKYQDEVIGLGFKLIEKGREYALFER